MSIRDQNVTKITRHYRQMDFHRELDVSKLAFSIRAMLLLAAFTNFSQIYQFPIYLLEETRTGLSSCSVELHLVIL